MSKYRFDPCCDTFLATQQEGGIKLRGREAFGVFPEYEKKRLIERRLSYCPFCGREVSTLFSDVVKEEVTAHAE